MVEISKIATNSIKTSSQQKNAETKKTTVSTQKNITDLNNIEQHKIGISAPISYKFIGQIPVLGDLKANIYKLANGQNVIILPKKGATVVKTYVNVGSMNEPDNLRGISHYIEHNLFNGTRNLKAGDFFNRVNSLGASTNASTSFSTTDYFISSQLLKKGDLEEKIKLHSDMLQNPIFAPDMLDKERGPVISEISMVMDEPQNIALNLALKNLYQIKTASRDLIAGTIENIKNVTRDDVLNYYNTHYTPDNFTTVISGDVNPDEAISLISKYFTKQNSQKPMVKKYETLTPIEKSIRVDETSSKATASTIVTAFAGAQNNNTKDKIASEVLMLLLCGTNNSRLKKTLEQLFVSIDSGIEKIGNKETDRKALFFMANCTPDKVDTTINKIYKEIFDIQNGKITQKELNIIKKQLKSSIQTMEENSAEINSLIGSSFLDKDTNYLLNYKNILESLTVQDIQEAAMKFLDLNKASISVVNPDATALKKSSPVSFGNSGKNDFVQKKAYDTDAIKTYRLHNNLEVVTNPIETDLSNFVLTFKTPAPAAIRAGVSEILERMLNNGSMQKSKEKYFDEANENGINILFRTSPNSMECVALCDAKDTDKSIKMAKEVLLSPRFTQENFEFVKNEIKEILQKMPKSAEENARAELFAHLPYYSNREDLLKSVESITLDEVKGFYTYLMQNACATCVSSAPFEKQPELVNIFNSQLGMDMPIVKPFKANLFNSFTPVQKNKIIAQADERNQAEIVKCYKFKSNANLSDYAKFSLLNLILGGNPNSRLFNDLREKQKLAYRVRSSVDFVDNTGIFSLYIKTTTDNPHEGNDKLDNVKKSLVGFDKNIQKIMQEYVSDEELESAKLYLKTKILDSAETSESKTALITNGKESLYGIESVNILLAEIDKVTKEDINAAAKYIFSGNALTSIVASKKTLDHFKSDLK